VNLQKIAGTGGYLHPYLLFLSVFRRYLLLRLSAASVIMSARKEESKMMNVFVLVGKVKEKPEVSTTAKGNSVAHMIVEADRNFRNEDGSLSSDLFKITLWKGIADECAAICHEGSLVAIRGRLRSDLYNRNDRDYYNCEIIAEQVKFLDGRVNRNL